MNKLIKLLPEHVQENLRIYTWTSIGASIGLSIILFFCSLTMVDNYELGYLYNRFTGEIERLERSGWHLLPCWKYSVDTIDMRPQQIQISANQRVLNAKLVRFNPEGLEVFLEWHGRGAGSDTRDLAEILKCYAFNVNGGKDCPFLSVEESMEPKIVEGKLNQAVTPQPTPTK